MSQVVLHDWEVPEMAVLIDAPTGCSQCEEAGQVQPGHSQCGVTPALTNDSNVYPRLEQGWGWILEFIGDDEHVDEWVDDWEAACKKASGEISRIRTAWKS
ncbi:MAG: hypothetical protein GY938_16945 [Ketobacter sp.]|nr:hypothetical protein [Ketobacter sp.]